MKKIILGIAAICISAVVLAQNLKPVAQKISNKKISREAFVQENLFDISPAATLRSTELANVVSNATVMEFRQADAQNILATKPDNINFIIPVNGGAPVELELYKATIFTPPV